MSKCWNDSEVEVKSNSPMRAVKSAATSLANLVANVSTNDL